MKDDEGFVDFSSGVSEVDPAVAALLGQGVQRKSEQRLSPKERRKRLREREKARSRNRVIYDIASEIEEAVKAIANEHDCPISQVAGLLLAYGVKAVRDHEIELSDYKETSRSPRYGWNLDFDAEEIWENQS